MWELNENLKNSYYYTKNVEPVLSSIESIKDQGVKKSIRDITNNFNENTSKEELIAYMEQIDKILIKYEVQWWLATTSSQVERSQVLNQDNPTSEEPASSSEFKGLVSPETWKISDSESGVLWTATWVVAGFADAWEQGKSAVKEKLNLGGEESIEIDQEKAKQFAKLFLEKNNWYIDFWFWKVESKMKEVLSLDNDDLAEEIKEIDLYIDVDTEDWNKYFKEHNIPQEQQDEFKKYFSELVKWQKNTSEFTMWLWLWHNINSEVDRINSLPDDTENITINIDEFNPEWEKLVFETKKEALLYLYYNKLLLNEVAVAIWKIPNFFEIVKDILAGIYWVWAATLSSAPYIFMTLVPLLPFYISTSMSLTIYRNFNWFLLRNNIPILTKKFARWVKLQIWNEWMNNINETEIRKRVDKIEYLKRLYAGDTKALKQLDKIEKKWLSVSDWSLTNTENKWFPESTFWRKIYNFEAQKSDSLKKVWNNKYTDTFFKLWLNDTEKITVWDKVVSFRNTLFNKVDWNFKLKDGTFFSNMKKNILLDHSISNEGEEKLQEIIKKYEDMIKNLSIWDLLWENNIETEEKVKKQILKELKEKYPILDENIFSESNYKDLKNKIDIDNDIKIKSFVDSLSITNEGIKNNIETFLKQVAKGDLNYSTWSWIIIMHYIMKWNNVDTSIGLAFENFWKEDIKIIEDELWNNSIINKLNSSIVENFYKQPWKIKEEKVLKLTEEYKKHKAWIIASPSLTELERKNILSELENNYNNLLSEIKGKDIKDSQGINDFNVNEKIKEFKNLYRVSSTWTPIVTSAPDSTTADNILNSKSKKRTWKKVLEYIWNTWTSLLNKRWEILKNKKEKNIDADKLKIKRRAIYSIESISDEKKRLEAYKKINKVKIKDNTDYLSDIEKLFDPMNWDWIKWPGDTEVELKTDVKIKTEIESRKNEIEQLKRLWMEIDFDSTTWDIKIKKDIYTNRMKWLTDKNKELIRLIRSISK